MEKKMRVTFLKNHKQINLENTVTIMEAARKVGVDVNPICGGNGTCGKCKVMVTKGNDHQPTSQETTILSEEELQKGIRLACQCHVKEDMCVIVNTPSSDTSSANQEETLNSKPILSQHDPLGIAIDIGTTTIAFSIVNKKSKQRVITKTFMNPQRSYGADVISRIAYCYQNRRHIQELQQLLLETCRTEIKQALNQIQAKMTQVSETVIVCNTTMSHIYCGESVDGIAKAPIKLQVNGGTYIKTAEMSLFGEPVYLASNIGGHVGSDALACAIATNLENETRTVLMIDVGTNGEIILAHNGQLVACSTAAGPAFEGANISCGMCATEGAIVRYRMDRGNVSYEVRGNVDPIGISGSGIIDIIAEMCRCGAIDETGRINEIHWPLGSTSGDGSLELTNKNRPRASTQENRPQAIHLTQQDIRQVQLAKAAIMAGIKTLLSQYSLTESDLDEVLLAGSFGSNITIANGVDIGLLPRVPLQRIRYVGNGALAGAEQILLAESKGNVEKFAKSIHHLELADTEEFNKTFVDCLNF